MNKNIIISISEVIMGKYTIKNHDGIYADMYGRVVKDVSDIIFIKKEELKTTVQNDAFWFRWGWPGPDINFYYFKDYGKTWAWTKEELVKNIQ